MPKLVEVAVSSIFVAPLVIVVLASVLVPVPEQVSPEMSTDKLKTAEIIPDVLDDVPAEPIQVKYHELEVKMGNELTPKQVAKKPTVSWTGHPGRLYTLAMVDPDAPSRSSPKFRNWLHWLVTNIPGQKIQDGNVIADYAGSSPPQGTKQHRYVFLVFEQDNKIEHIPKIEKRGGFDLRKFVNDNRVGKPVAGNFFVAQHQS